MSSKRGRQAQRVETEGYLSCGGIRHSTNTPWLRQFRRALTPPEVRLWARLKGKSDGLHFRKQHPIGPYIVDFYCPKANLIIEVDGIVHDIADVAAKDERRSEWLASFGLEILRVVANEVMADRMVSH